MKSHYDFSKGKRNPYAKKLKQAINIRIDKDVIAYFKGLGESMSIPYQTLINLYLRECAEAHKKPITKWKAGA